ncbi:hypothetical protein COCCADRAFT_87031, partial [Bipolaris zeicola 26-R-13]
PPLHKFARISFTSPSCHPPFSTSQFVTPTVRTRLYLWSLCRVDVVLVKSFISPPAVHGHASGAIALFGRRYIHIGLSPILLVCSPRKKKRG